jgi:hypothetical protein
MKTCNFKVDELDESFDYQDESLFDQRLEEILGIIVKLKKMVAKL